MNLLKNLFGKKEEQSIGSNADFWAWFQSKEKMFFTVIQQQRNIEKNFIIVLQNKLAELKEGYLFQVGMDDENTAELILTPNGAAKNIGFVEELAAAAPALEHWKITSLKPAIDFQDRGIKIGGFEFKTENLHFYSNDLPNHPDEIDITVVYDNYDEEQQDIITNGIYIFLDNYLGELLFTTTVDNLVIVDKESATQELVPIDKLNDFLTWRQKEFVEKYEGTWCDIENDQHAIFKSESGSGNALIATINTDVLKWDAKASHPWLMIIQMQYDGNRNNGMPSEETLQLRDEIEEEIMLLLKTKEGYINIGRETGDHCIEIYFACKGFRKPSKVLYDIEEKYSERTSLSYDITKDKYWRLFDKYSNEVM